MASLRNDDFRKLVSSTPARHDDGSSSTKAPALGTKKSSFVPMTPRPGKAPSGSDFARQVREQHASLKPAKKWKSSAPKGSKFAAGYTDRAKARQEAEDDEDDKAKRIKALEEQVKLGQLEQPTFEALRDEILGGDISNTHLVKGLDRRLLERVRRGENVFSNDESKSEEPPADVDEELDKLEGQEVETVKKEKTQKKGVMAPPPVAGVKRSRDEIMAELKAQRRAAAEAKAAAAPTFDNRWKKMGEQAKPKIEIDHKGREVMITVDEDGNVKKKVRKAPVKMPDVAKPVLGAEIAVPEAAPALPEDEDDDIFDDVGAEYNPLGDLEEDSDDDENERSTPERKAEPSKTDSSTSHPTMSDREPPGAHEGTPKARPNYFKDNEKAEAGTAEDRLKGIENVLKKAARLDGTMTADHDGPEDETKENREARLAKRAKMLQQDRDFEDMDMGFGGSRFEDEEDAGDGTKIRLSQWKGAGEDDGWGEEGKGSGKKKRKPKKRKGDVNNAADIMRVIEGRRAANSN